MEIAGGGSKNRLSFSEKQTEQFQEKWNSRDRLELFAVLFWKKYSTFATMEVREGITPYPLYSTVQSAYLKYGSLL